MGASEKTPGFSYGDESEHPLDLIGTYILIKSRGGDIILHKTFKFRIYPNKDQRILINKTIGCSRFVDNHLLEKWNKTYEETGNGLTYKICSRLLTELKKELEWLQEVDSTALQNSLKHLEDAFKRFFSRQN
jgi:putative transposase